jgi:hypothetical protein
VFPATLHNMLGWRGAALGTFPLGYSAGGRRKALLLCGLAGGVLGFGSLCPRPVLAREGRTLHVVVDEVQHEVRPKPGTKWRNLRVTLTRQDENLYSEGFATGSRRLTKADGGDFVFGPDGRGRRANVEWTRVGNNTFLRVMTTSSYVQTIQIVRTGRTCAATLRYALRPGHREFVLRRIGNDERMFVRRIDVNRITCWIGEALAS